MTLSDLQGIRQRLQQTIESLEKQTQSLRQDLQVIDGILAQSANTAQEQPQAAPPTAQQAPPEADTRSELEKATIALLEKMQKKVYAQEILGDLYCQMAGHPPVENARPSPDPQEPMTDAQLEKTVQQIKQKDALDELKKKMGFKN